MLTAFWLLIACMFIMIVTTFLFPETLKPGAEALVWDSWREPLRNNAGGVGLASLFVFLQCL